MRGLGHYVNSVNVNKYNTMQLFEFSLYALVFVQKVYLCKYTDVTNDKSIKGNL